MYNLILKAIARHSWAMPLMALTLLSPIQIASANPVPTTSSEEIKSEGVVVMDVVASASTATPATTGEADAVPTTPVSSLDPSGTATAANPAAVTPIEASTVAPPEAASTDSSALIDQISATASFDPVTDQLQTEAASDPMAQVTSVTQLSDVKPTDWAFQALQSLVEKYGCIVGYPDKTFRGKRAISRYEFAAGLNACMDRMTELLASATAPLVKKEDMVSLQKMMEEFAAELATLRGRVDALEARTAQLETQQFSTTTKLLGLTWFNMTGAFSGGDVKFEAAPGPGGSLPGPNPDQRFAGRDAAGNPLVQRVGSAEPTFSYLTWLTFLTSFTGKDALVTQLAAGNGISPANQYMSAGFFNAGGVPFTDQTAGVRNGTPDLIIHDLFYSFSPWDNLKVTVGPRVNWYRHFDGNRFTFFLNGASSFNSIGSTLSNAIDRGSGGVLEWSINPKLKLAVAYLGENTEFLPNSLAGPIGFNTSSNPFYGLFSGTNTTTAELTYSPTSNVNLRFMYNYSKIQAYFGQVGGAIGEPVPYGQLDGGPLFGSVLNYATAHTAAFNFDWLVNSKFGIFGRYGYGATTLSSSVAGVNGQVVNVQAVQLGFAFPDLGKKGAQAVLSFTMPMEILQGRQFFVAGGGNGGTQYEIEASYYFPLTANIAVVPAFYVLINPNNFYDNPDIYVANIRAQFSF